MSYTHPYLSAFFDRDTDNGKRNEKLYVLSREDGVLVVTERGMQGTQYMCRRVLIPDFPGASPHNYSTFPDVHRFTTAEDVTDFVDVCGELEMKEVASVDELYNGFDEDD